VPALSAGVAYVFSDVGWSQDSRRIQFGLATAKSVSPTIKWPSGLVQTFPEVAAD
jgi:hypothetical protein